MCCLPMCRMACSSEQIDLVIPATAERADYICEIKFSEGRYVLKEEDAEDVARHIDALRNSSIHKPTHSVYVTLITSFGVTESKHRSHLNDILTLDSLF